MIFWFYEYSCRVPRLIFRFLIWVYWVELIHYILLGRFPVDNKTKNKISHNMWLSYFYKVKLWYPKILRYHISHLISIENRPKGIKLKTLAWKNKETIKIETFKSQLFQVFPQWTILNTNIFSKRWFQLSKTALNETVIKFWTSWPFRFQT